jgi:glycosyltransferase involved in cell wall biosynthesis
MQTTLDSRSPEKLSTANELLAAASAAAGKPKKAPFPKMGLDTPGFPRVSVIIPALNEAENLPHVLRRLPRGVDQVVLVDGDSTDDTVAVARREWPEIEVIQQPARGKGDALRAGLDAASGDIVITLDADGSADPAELPRYVERLIRGQDLVKGSRNLEGGGTTDMTRVRKLGNAGLRGMVNLLYGTKFSDLCYGYNALWSDCLPKISLDAPGFEVETELQIRSAKANLKIAEVPSFEAPRINGESNLRTWRDGFRVLKTITRELRSPRDRKPSPGPWLRRRKRFAPQLARAGVGLVSGE